jgi:hypothetical protein
MSDIEQRVTDLIAYKEMVEKATRASTLTKVERLIEDRLTTHLEMIKKVKTQTVIDMNKLGRINDKRIEANDILSAVRVMKEGKG